MAMEEQVLWEKKEAKSKQKEKGLEGKSMTYEYDVWHGELWTGFG